MIYGQPTKTLARKITGSRYHLRHFSVPDSPRGLLSHTGITRNYCCCYACNNRNNCLPDLETQTRFQLVVKEGIYG